MLARYLDGDVRAFEELVGRFGPSVYGFLQRTGVPTPVAEDLFQEAFTRVHVAARRYNPAYPFRVWLLSITHNLVRSHFRKQRLRRIFTPWWHRSPHDPHGEPRPLDPPDDSPGAEREAIAREQLRWLEQALSSLPEGPRQAIVLTQVEGLNQEEAARVLGVPVATLKTWLRRGRLQLAEALQPSGEVAS